MAFFLACQRKRVQQLSSRFANVESCRRPRGPRGGQRGGPTAFAIVPTPGIAVATAAALADAAIPATDVWPRLAPGGQRLLSLRTGHLPGPA